MAFYFDRAIYTFGSALEAAIEKAGSGRGKRSESQIAMARQQVQARWLGAQKFADPVPRG